MTRLAVEAEIIKLAHILGVSQTQLNFFKPLAPESLRQFRFGIIEQLQDQQKKQISLSCCMGKLVTKLVKRIYRKTLFIAIDCCSNCIASFYRKFISNR